MKKPTIDERKRMCTGKRRYRTQGDALDAALVAGVERQRQAYQCRLCGFWHLTSADCTLVGRDRWSRREERTAQRSVPTSPYFFASTGVR